MKHLPNKYQIFDSPVEVSEKDIARLKSHLGGWNQLNELFLIGIAEIDLRRLILLEVHGASRMPIINRLLGRLAKVERRKLLSRIQKLAI